MTETSKTLTYVAIAAVMAIAGIFLAPRGPRATGDGIEALIGTEFYKNFKNPSEATSIEVVSYDPATATATPFSVEYKDGLWRIPTRYNYPADAKDRLAKAAASIVGLKREALAGRSESEQAEFQVLDPKGEKVENLKGIGNRLTLRNGTTVLADYIIGKQVPNRPGYYYVRRPDEKQTFIAKVELNLSTKFTDWIESDVLNLDGFRLTHIDIMKHSLEIKQNRARLVGQEQNILTRKNSSDPWKLDGLDEATEEVNQEEVRKLVDALDNLKIVGVRPKPESLRRGLQSNEGITLDPETEDDLASRGFFFLPTQRGGVQMISMEGDLTAGTDQGVEYEMHFGSVFEGTEEEIELGFAKPQTEEAKSEDGDKKEGEGGKDSKADDKAGTKKKSRFIFVTARVNPGLLGPEPEEPIKPEPPAEQPAAGGEKSDETKSGEATGGDDAENEKPSASEPADAAATTEKPSEGAQKSPEATKDDPKKAYEAALKKYEADKSKYESDVKAREDKLKEADEKVRSLNARFADWYYVISAESFENLRQGRKTLVKPKAETKPEEKPSDGEAPDAENSEGPSGEKPDSETSSQEPDGEK